MAEAVYILCAMASLACAGLLLRSYLVSRLQLILWTSLCFAGLSINNIVLVIDLALLPGMDLSFWRNITALAAVLVLLYGLITSDVT